MPIQESGEMYLETILILGKEKATVRAIDVSEYMGFSKPSVSRAVGLLKENGLLTVDDHGALLLTDRGYAIAQKIYDRHKILSIFFEKLGVDPQIADDDACKIEHHISDESLEAIKKFVDKN